ncbi:unnamed protein product [Prorocentrum cordatum]|uniref:Uncharacterized protein n=1 Tax=Prorocentrum cordatum TaxID=2364126 RepID=A0ABN9RZZ8_9DINO|nr:unnamed protein product [Polarella glacialis]
MGWICDLLQRVGVRARRHPRAAHCGVRCAKLGDLVCCAPPKKRQAERLRVQPLCMGHGWLPNLSPEDALAASAGAAEARSVVSAAPPSALSAAAPASVVSAAGPEVVSQLSVAPPARSALSASAPALRSALSAAAPSGLAGQSALAPTAPPAAASCVAPAAPLRGGHPASQLSAASSLPALREGGDARALLQRREAKLGRLVERSRAYLKNGERGEAWFKGRPRTDATYFQEHFARNNGGLPPHKVRGARDFAKPSIP